MSENGSTLVGIAFIFYLRIAKVRRESVSGVDQLVSQDNMNLLCYTN